MGGNLRLDWKQNHYPIEIGQLLIPHPYISLSEIIETNHKIMNFKMLVLLSFVLPTGLFAQQSYLDEFQEKWHNATAYTLEVAELMPDSSYHFAPTADQMTFQKQLLHICRNMTWLSTSYLHGTDPEVDLKASDYSKKEVIDMLKNCLEKAGAAAKALPEKELEEMVDFFAGPKSKRQILTLMNDHMTHHRGQILVYLRLQGITPPKYRGW
ncbi:MAG: hypothetical protein DHS20C18_20050 [Saprospiraceae bacterium]|nr:MAG: hypothetical protein DHS20C18_20050 [Saprospiraceae bacterium]